MNIEEEDTIVAVNIETKNRDNDMSELYEDEQVHVSETRSWGIWVM